MGSCGHLLFRAQRDNTNLLPDSALAHFAKLADLVIPAKAGIESAAASGSRVKPGMTVNVASIGFNLTMY